LRKKYQSDEDYDDVDQKTRAISKIAKNLSPFKPMDESIRQDMYDESEWEWQGEKRKSYSPNEKFFLQKAKNYKQMMVNLSKMVLEYKKLVVETLAPYMDYIDKKVYESLLYSIDRLYDYINGDSSKIKGEKTRLQYSIVEMLDKYINKDNTNYKLFF
jgi:alkyl sulfatase BDS1-like metallo-beta-lactamase superfamily hydrolase